MDHGLRNKLRNTVTQCRKLLEEAVAQSLQGQFGIYAESQRANDQRPGTKDIFVEDASRMTHLAAEDQAYRGDILDSLEHIKALGSKPKEALDQLIREIAFTHLNRLCAYKMMETRQVWIGGQRFREAVSRGQKSQGFMFYLADHPEDEQLFRTGQQEMAYRHFLDWLGSRLSEEIGVLFNPNDPANRLYPSQRVLDEVLALINSEELAGIWTEDETIGWVYQYFTPKELRDQARKQSQAPRNSYELAFRNQFFTPRYVVEFLTDNTLGRAWYEMRQGKTVLKERCQYLVRRPNEVFLSAGEEVPENRGDARERSQEEPLQESIYVPHRPKKDPRDIRILDPACGSGHFLLYAFDLLTVIYEEAWTDPDLGPVLWKDLHWAPPANTEEHGPFAAPGSVRLKPQVEAGCFRCGRLSSVPDACFILADLYHSPWLSGRPMIYCRPCVNEMSQAIALTIPLEQFNFERALQRGWFAHSTGTTFLELAGVFDYALTDTPEGMIEALSAAHADEALAILHRALPGLILRHNLHGIDIDVRATQIAALALWLRAQRAYQAIGLKSTERPTISKSNIVCAEPMPGEEDLLNEFVATLQPIVLGQLVQAVFQQMKLAGEAGSLLKIEEEISKAVTAAKQQWLARPKAEQLALWPEDKRPTVEQLGLFDVSGITDEEFWHQAEARVLDALHTYARHAANGTGLQRQLFADDATRGFAFVDLCRRQFDVVLMNPPFGEASKPSKVYVDKAYPRTKNDVYAAFVERGLQLLYAGGMLGAITSRTGYFLSSFQKWREEILLREAWPTVFADLGYGVLDTAMVETAAYCLSKTAPAG